MKFIRRLTTAFIFSLLACNIAAAQAGPPAAESTAKDQANGHWFDSDTGLTWTARDSGRDLSWKGAVKYCQSLRLGGYSDWRLPDLFELGGIYDPKANAPGLSGLKPSPTMWHVKGNLYLTLYEWSKNKVPNDRGRPSAYAYYFDFISGQSNNQPTGWPYPYAGMRALCVRGTGDPLAGQRKAARN